MKGIKGTRCYQFVALAPSYAQNPGTRVSVICQRPDGHRKVVEVSKKTAERLAHSVD